MPSDLISQSVAAGATVELLAARPFSFFGEASILTVYANGSAAGLTLSLTAFRGGKAGAAHIPAGAAIGAASTAGKIKTNEDFIGQYAIEPGSRVLLNVTNPTAGALTVLALLIAT